MEVYKANFAPRRPLIGLRGPKQHLGRSAELKNGLKVDFGAFWSILGGVNGSQIGNFDQKMGVSKAIFAFQRPPRALKMPKSYLESSAEFKNGLKVEI